MSGKSARISVACPHCGSSLKIDIEAGVVVEHQPPAQVKEKVDFEGRLKQMEEDKRRAADKMAEAMRREQSRGRLMEDRFRELMEKAKESDDGTPPVREIDLD